MWSANRRTSAVAIPVGLGVLLALAGCGGGGSTNPPPRALSASTSHGLSYTARITVSGKTQCVSTSYRSALATGQPILQGSHLCGPPAQPGHAVLIQAHGSPESLLSDVSAAGCDTVRGGGTHATLRTLVSRCTTGNPRFRVTILPPARRLVIVGVVGVPVLNFPRHICRSGICVTPLA
ncbi:MAG TPA: hypothetical protein VHW26_06575 [Solirubrobacteraceae bacterium]|jgi:hypothetical protein|nr:hypothetical protein [Solirubrobacteraceae bacterium]